MMPMRPEDVEVSDFTSTMTSGGLPEIGHDARLIVHPELPCEDCGDTGMIAGDTYMDYCHCPAGRLLRGRDRARRRHPWMSGRDSLADLQRYDLTDEDRG